MACRPVLVLCFATVLLSPLAAGTPNHPPNLIKKFGLTDLLGHHHRDGNVNLRLPNDTIPLNYRLSLDTNIHEGNENYTGVVEIMIQCVNKTKKIVLHSRSLKINEVYLDNEKLGNYSVGDETDFLTIELVKELVENQTYSLRISFDGVHASGVSGWYKGSYLNVEKNETT